ncbi:MAG: BREX system ATP-binding domain-containing protein [Geminicoccaceae bacterium]
MRCSACGTDNEDGRRFCGECGGRLAVPCADCGFANAAEARFCGGCGRRLGEPAAQPAAERRQVTVLFADLAGYTRLSSRADPEQVQALLDRFFERVDGQIVAHGGSVNQHLGDAVLALFGAPVAHDDDPRRAVQAALAIHAEVAGLAAPDGTPLAVHVGVASGVVVAAPTGSQAHRIYTVTGDSVNLAARLMDMAKAGETLVSAPVHAALARQLVATPRGEVAVKGIEAPVPVWLVQGWHDDAGSTGGPLVGRRAELAQVLGLLEAAGEGSGGIAVLRGEAGIGKSRLAREVVARAQARGFAVHAASVLDFGAGRAEEAIRQMVRSLAGEQPGLPAELVPFLRELRGEALAEDERRLVDALRPAEREQARNRVVATLLRQAAAAGPVLLLVEDLHWAHESLLATLAALAAVVAEMPVVLLATTRVEGDPLEAGGRQRFAPCPVVTVDLGPLRSADARELAGALFAGSGGIEQLIERAGGNPLFLEQLVHDAAEARTGVPATIRSLVQARVDRLQPAARNVVQAAAVLGQRFAAPAVAALAPVTPDALAELVQRRLVEPDGAAYRFCHALLRDGVYQTLLLTRRQALHARAAAWFAGRDLRLEAEHLERAGDPAAAAAYERAARAELAAYRNAEALELVRAGRSVGGEAAAALALLEGEVLLELGEAVAAEQAIRDALASAAEPLLRCRALIGLAEVLRLADRLDEAFAALAEAEAIAGPSESKAELSRLHHLRGNLLFPLGRTEACMAEHRAALRDAEACGDAALVARALGGLADAEYATGRFASAHRSFAGCVAAARERGLGRIDVANRAMLAICRGAAGPLHGAAAEAAEAVAEAVRVGNGRAELIARHGAVLAAIWQADMPAALAHLDRVDAITTRLGLGRFEPENIAFRGWAMAESGAGADALAVLEHAHTLALQRAATYFGGISAGLLAWAAPAGRLATLLPEGEALLRETRLRHNDYFFRLGAIEGTLRCGLWAEAERQAGLMEATFADEPLPLVALIVGRGRTLAAWGRGDRSAGLRTDLAEIDRQADTLGYPLLRRAVAEALAG